jgi:gamma-glutamyltranspeptidase/glutathione hydrolase
LVTGLWPLVFGLWPLVSSLSRPARQNSHGTAINRQSPHPGRSIVTTTLGIVAASQPLAAKAGAEVLDRGGNAIDAAIAANAVLGLVEPHMNGVGGDLFAIICEAKTGKLHGLNASGWAPTGLTPALIAERGLTRMPNSGIFSVTVPGAGNQR